MLLVNETSVLTICESYATVSQEKMNPLPLFKNITTSCQNVLRVLLVLFAIFFFCGCEAKRDVKIGETAPEFSSTDITGKSVSLSQFKGKIVIIYFWRNSCCADSLKSVEPYYRSNRHKELAVIAINLKTAVGCV